MRLFLTHSKYPTALISVFADRDAVLKNLVKIR